MSEVDVLQRFAAPCRGFASTAHRARRWRGAPASRRRLALLEQLEDRIQLASVAAHPSAASIDAISVAPPPISGPLAQYVVDTNHLRSTLSAAPLEFTSEAPAVIELPDPNGELMRFAVVESPAMASQLAAKFPEIRTFRGYGVDDPAASVRVTLTSADWQAHVRSAATEYHVESLAASNRVYVDGSAHDQRPPASGNLPSQPAEKGAAQNNRPLAQRAGESSGMELRVLRTAIAATGEYTAFFGGTVGSGLSAIVTAINRINEIYESELAIRFELIADNDQLIYTDPANDPYTDSDTSALIVENQQNLDSVIQDQNYDIGHVLGFGAGGGLAVEGAGIPGVKAQGASGSQVPTGDRFWVNVLAHELGHQLSARHTWNGVDGRCVEDQRRADSAFEPGSGSTILAYTGICGSDNLQVEGDPHFHSRSFDQIIDYIENAIPAVGTRLATGNTIPLVDAGPDFTIPARTPFALTARATDADVGDSLTYSWEQRDLGPARALDAGDDGLGPLFRVWPPTIDATRVLPRLANLVNNSAAIGETLPATTRDMNFRVIVRDSRGGVSGDDMVVHVVDTGMPFRVTVPNTGLSYPALSAQTVSWDVAGTDSNGVDVSHVNILLSSDGGLTFPFVLAAQTRNDGSEQVVLPDLRTGSARVKVEAAGNVFFDLSDTNFSISAPQRGVVAMASDGLVSVSEGGAADTYNVSLNTVPGGSVTVRVTADPQVEISSDGVLFSDTLDLTFSSTAPQLVNVRAIDDAGLEGLHTAVVTHSVVATADPAAYPLTLAVNDVTIRIADNELAAFERLPPLGGSLSVSRGNFGTLAGSASGADFPISVASGESLAAVIRGQGPIPPILSVELVGLAGPFTASTPGAAVLPAISVPATGTVLLRVTADGPAEFDFDVYRNVELEAEVADSSDGNELNIDRLFGSSGASRAAAWGVSDADTGDESRFFARNDPAAFIDISGSNAATSLNLATNGNTIITTSVGNSHFPAGLVTVGINGGAVAGSGGFNVIPANAPLPDPFYGTALFPFWDSLSGRNAADVLWEERQVGGIDTLIIQWNQVEHLATPGGASTFQLQVFESGPVFARYAYRDVEFGDPSVDFGASATIGYQASGTEAVEFGFKRVRLSNGSVLDLALFAPDVDEYQVDLTGHVGRPVDLLLAGRAGGDFRDERIELLATDGATVLARGVRDPVQTGTDATNFDLGILDFVVPENGVYTLRVTSKTADREYSVVVSDAATFDTEPNDNPSSAPPRSLDGSQAAVGFLGASDRDDYYRVGLPAGVTVTIATQTPLSATEPGSDLDPEIQVIHPNGSTVVASDLDSAADGKNATVTWTVPLAGTYRIRVRATEGVGEYLVGLVTDAPPIPQVVLTIDKTSIPEAGGVATVTAQLSTATTVPVTVELAFTGSAAAAIDYDVSGSSMVIPPGSTAGTITVTAIPDTLVESGETVIVEIAAATNANDALSTPQATTIVDDDGPLSGAAPSANRNDAPRSSNVSYTFAEVVNPATGSPQTFAVHGRQSGRLLDGNSAFAVEDTQVRHDPVRDFFPGEVVQATVTSALAATMGPVLPRVWKFRAAASGGTGELSDTGQSLAARISLGTALGDLDGDGDLDAFLANYGGQDNRVWFNDGGRFTDSQQSLGSGRSTAVELGDLDGDGDLDAFVSNLSGQPNRVWRNDAGRFTDSGQSLGNHNDVSVALGDLDGDGDLDAFTANYPAQGNHVWLNDGGRFIDSGQSLGLNSSWRVELGDLDLDGDLDAFEINVNQGNRVWMNDGMGRFTDTSQSLGDSTSLGAELGDLDGDGDLDAFVANFGQSNRVWVNDGTGRFSNSGQTLGDHQGYGAALGDLDGDGDLDAFVTNLNQPDRIWLNDGTGRLTDSGQGLGDHASSHVSLGDLDSDGDLDAFVAHFGQASRVFLNENAMLPAVRLTVDQTLIPEAGGSATLLVTISAATSIPVTVELGFAGTATAGVDYTAGGNQVVIEPGATTAAVHITAVQDTAVESNETVIVDILSVAGGLEEGQQQQTITITDDDEPPVPDVTLSVDLLTIPEAGGTATFIVTLSEATTVPVTVELGFGGTAAATDYNLSTAQVVVAPGFTNGIVTVTAVQDVLSESDETVVVDIVSVSGGNEAGNQQSTTTIVDDDPPASFLVTSLVPQVAGFRVEFAGELHAGTLNLYGEDPDVILTGTSGGTLAGSLIIDTSAVTFVKSGGPLVADTYQVVLRSAADGFQSRSAMLLDGNGDGNGGDDYVAEFIVNTAPAGARVVTIPDFVRGPGQDVELPASTGLGIPVTISDGQDVREIQLQIGYDPELLQITGATATGSGSVSLSTPAPGTALLEFTSAGPLPADNHTFVYLQAAIPADNAGSIYGRLQQLDLSALTIRDGSGAAIPAVADDAVQLSAYFADVSGNGRINASDAARLARFAALLETSFAVSANADPFLVGDISGNGRVNAADASLIARFAALLPVSQIPAIPAGILIAGARRLGEKADGNSVTRETAQTELLPAGLEFADTSDFWWTEPDLDELAHDHLSS